MNKFTQIIEELSNLNPPQKSFDNKQMIKALNLINNPQNTYKVIHIAGTNGKGSTAAFIEAGLMLANYKVGKFTSPYIHCINECICINSIIINDQELVTLYTNHKALLEANNIYLSSFEMLTLLMFVYCKQQQIDYLILETGLGGRDDSTNVVNSQYSIITNISLEHTQILGNSLTEIAQHKAGIIKNGLTILGDSSPELIEAAKQKTTNLISVKDYYQITNIRLDNHQFKTLLEFKDNDTKHKFMLNLFGYFQAYNFLCAFTVLTKIGVSLAQITLAANSVNWHGRLNLINHAQGKIIVDASHNVDGVTKLSQSLTDWFDYNNSIIICSILNDKNQADMLTQYSKISTNIIFCDIPQQPRTSQAINLAKLAKGKFSNIYVCDTPQQALTIAKTQHKAMLLISGSCYLLKYFL